MQRARTLFGVLLVSVPFAFVACGDDEDGGDGGNGGSGGSGKGGKGGTAGSITGGTTTGGKGGTAGSTGGTTTGGRGGTSTGGDAGMGGAGGEDGGQGGEGGQAGEAGQGGSAGAGMGGGGMAGGGMAGSGGTAPTCDPVDPPAIFVGLLQGSQEVPPVATTATGVAIAELNAAENQLTTSAYWSGLTTGTHLGHIHGPAVAGASAGVVFDLMPPLGETSGSVVARTFPINATQVALLKAGLLYTNIHSTMFMAGEVRAQLLPVSATALRTGTLQGSQEVPPVASSGTGRAVAVVFPNGTQAAVSVTWSGMTTGTHLGHIHGPAAAGTPAGVLFNLNPTLGATSGSVTHLVWDMTTAHSTALLGNLTYANIHSTMFMSGELRAQLLPPCP
jgi:hypothetical protein